MAWRGTPALQHSGTLARPFAFWYQHVGAAEAWVCNLDPCYFLRTNVACPKIYWRTRMRFETEGMKSKCSEEPAAAVNTQILTGR
jgi:hypothetical protein